MNKRPYEQKTISRRSAILFGCGVLAIVAILLVTVGMSVPLVNQKLDSAWLRARIYYRQLFPPPKYLPTPVPVTQITVTHQPVRNKLDLSLVLHEATATPTATPSPTSTTPATPPPTNTPSPTPTPTITPQPAGERIQITELIHQYQTWNNCGPSTITMQMSHFGFTNTQAEAAKFLKPNRDDKNVSPHELAAYAQANGLSAIVRRGGTVDMLKLFLSNDLPVIVETWFEHDGDEMGHYRLVTGYDEQTQQIITFDSYNGPNVRLNYEEFTELWRVFNYLYVVSYPPEQTDVVTAIIGEDMADGPMYERLLALAEVDLAANPEDKIAYFNKGEALTRLDRPQEAVAAFDQARRLQLHWRRLWYQFTPFEAYYAVGRYQDVIDLSQAIIKSASGLEEGYYYLGMALHATGQPGATENFQAAIDYNPNFRPAEEALTALERE